MRSAISILGVALGVALIMLFTGLAHGMSEDLQKRSSNVSAEIIFTRPGSMQLTSSSANLNTKYVELLQNIEGVESVTPVIRYFYPSGSFGIDQVEGIEWKFPGNKIQFTREVFATIENSIPGLNIFLNVLVGLAAVVSALVVMLAMHTTITERTREIGILKAMGASRRYIISEIEREALLISFLGMVVGFALAALAGFGIHKATGLIFQFGGWWALTAALIGLAGGALGAFYPAARAANLDPVNALAYE